MKCKLVKKLVLAFFCIGSFQLSAQFEKGIKVGDKAPDIVFNNILNYKTKKAKLSDFRGKLVILDMWSTYCTSCIAAFPEMEALQKKFGDKIQVLLVNSFRPDIDTEERIKSTLDKQKKRTGFYPTLPMPIHDTILETYFPHQTVPHEVWIDEDGIIIAITSSTNLNEKNINTYLSTGQINLPVKNDWGFDTSKPFLLDGNGSADGAFIYRSMLTGFKADLNSQYSWGMRSDANSRITGFFCLNQTLMSFLSTAYYDLFNDITDNRIIFDVHNPAKYSRSLDTANMYCYDVSFPASENKDFDPHIYLREDLKRIYNITVSRQRMKRKVLVIKSVDNISRLYSRYVKKEIRMEENELQKYYHAVTLEQLTRLLSARMDKPCINETGITQKIDINFSKDVDVANQEGLLSELKKAGLIIQEEEREIDVVIISDRRS